MGTAGYRKERIYIKFRFHFNLARPRFRPWASHHPDPWRHTLTGRKNNLDKKESGKTIHIVINLYIPASFRVRPFSPLKIENSKFRDEEKKEKYIKVINTTV